MTERVGAPLNRNLGSPIAPGEAADRQIDTFIERRHIERAKTEGPRPEEEAWAESERRHAAARRAENGRAWHEYHLRMAASARANLEALTTFHEAEAERYLPKGTA